MRLACVIFGLALTLSCTKSKTDAEAPADETVNTEPAAEAPAEEAPAEETPAEDAPSEDAPVEPAAPE